MYNDWLRALDFYRGEVNILRNRLTEIAGKNTADDTMKQVEHFENQFVLHTDNIDQLQHNIRENISVIGKEAAGRNGYVDASLLQKSEVQKNQFIQEEKLVHELRHAFNRFCIEHM